jgi:TPR repeat protein
VPDLKVAPEQRAVQPPPTAVLPEPRAAVSLSADEIGSMLRRGRDLIAAGDIASGRLMLTHVAEAGNAEAAFLLAGTYDAAVLAKLRVVGVQPDPAKARAWYARAADQGSLEARQRLQALR